MSVGATVPSLETTGLAATTSTLCEMPIARSSATSVDRPATTSIVAEAVTKSISDADTLYFPGGRATMLKWPSPSEASCVTCLPEPSTTITLAAGSRTVPLCVVTTP